jgi:hypothetical protein
VLLATSAASLALYLRAVMTESEARAVKAFDNGGV